MIVRGNNFPTVDQIVNNVTRNFKETEQAIKIVDFGLMLDLRTKISKTSTNPELNRIRAAIRKESKEHIPEAFRLAYEITFQRWGLMFKDNQTIVPTDLRKRLILTINFGDTGTIKFEHRSKKNLVAKYATRLGVKSKDVHCLHEFL